MGGYTIMYIVWAVLLLGILTSIFLAYRSRQLRAKRLLLMDLFNGYFRGDVRTDQLGPSTTNNQSLPHRQRGILFASDCRFPKRS